jgi:transcriptional regulator of arginine metabolism
MKLELVIRNLIQNNKIKTQSELGKILEKKGFSTTQSNISRILKKINTVKLIDENKETYYIIRSKPLEVAGWIKNLVLGIEANKTSIVIKTYAGASNLVRQIIKERSLDNVLAVIPEENAALVVPAEVSAIESLIAKLKALFLLEA